MKERLFIPFDEAEKLFQALERDHLVDIDDFLLKLGEKAAWIHLPRAERAGLCALEILPRICRALQVDLSAVNPAPLHEATAGKLAEGLKKLRVCRKFCQTKNGSGMRRRFLSASGCRTTAP